MRMLKAVVYGLVPIVIGGVVAWLVMTHDVHNYGEGRAKTRLVKEILGYLVDTIGQIPTATIAGLLGLVIGYFVYQAQMEK